jgi:sugar phosphate isomerase/epimerase
VNLIRLAALFGGNQNDIKVGTFVGYDRFLGREEEGFQKNLELYKRIFEPVINYASDHNVTILYENCPMEGLGGVKTQDTYNNLPCTLGARKLMYTLIPSDAHGETYDPSHDIWQFNNPLHVMKYFLWDKIHRIHIKSTRIKEDQASAEWGHVFRKQYVDPELAKRAQVKIAKSDMDRYNYRPTLPGFGDQGDFDWYRFFQELNKHHFNGPYVIENEAFNSMRTGNKKAVEQGICACRDFMAPNIWHLNGEEGYSYNKTTGSILNKEMKNIKAIKYKDLI